MVYVCPDCRESFKVPKQLLTHRREKHAGIKGGNRAALEVTLAELKKGGRLEPIDEAQVQMVRSLADELDRDATNAQMWRTYDEALKGLMVDEPKPEDLDSFKEAILRRAPVGHPKKARARNAGVESGGHC